MKVYVLVESWKYDGEDCGQSVSVFATLEKAKMRLNQEMIKAKEDMQQAVKYIVEDKDDDMDYSVYEEEAYGYNHIDIIIYQREVM